MSKHNKWSQIKRKKAVTDQKRAQAFTKLSKLITMAAKEAGGDPDSNASLALFIQKAKAVNMMKDLIDRAIKKGTGEAGAALDIQEVIYEGYTPHGVAVIVRTLTENRTRTVANIRHVFSKHGGSLGDIGTVSYLFQKKGLITLSFPREKIEEIELTLIDAGAEDFEVDEEGKLQCIVLPTDLHKVKKSVENISGVQVEDMSISYLPTMEHTLTSQEQIDEVLDFLELVEEDEDVDELFTNMKVEI